MKFENRKYVKEETKILNAGIERFLQVKKTKELLENLVIVCLSCPSGKEPKMKFVGTDESKPLPMFRFECEECDSEIFLWVDKPTKYFQNIKKGEYN